MSAVRFRIGCGLGRNIWEGVMGEKGNVSAELASQLAGAGSASQGSGALASVITNVSERSVTVAEQVAKKSVDVAVEKSGDRIEDHYDKRHADDSPPPDQAPSTET